MNLLLDANLSWRLSRNLSNHFEKVRHVDQIGIGIPAKDLDIWEWSRKNDFIIVTNDEDFLNLLIMKGFPPKVILLRTGNQSNKYLSDLLIQKKENILNLSESDHYGIIEFY